MNRGDLVVVEEPGAEPWEGTIVAIKPGRYCRWVEVRRPNGFTWAVPEWFVKGGG